MMKRDIHLNPYKYACVCNIPYELAKIQCLKYRHIDKEERKHRPFCPECGSKHIGYEMGSYEEGYSSFFYCDDCDQAYDEIPNGEYYSNFGSDFDVVLYFSCTEDKADGWREACGAETIEDWHEFARKEILGRNRKSMLIMSKQKVEYLSDEELKDFIPIVTKAIESICKLSDKHNFDRNSMFKYFANHISAMSEIATIENYSFEEAKE